MKRTLRILTANPAGNITIFVLDSVDRAHYQQVATQLLAIEELRGEQVAFVTGENSMEMCGLEFCGNASRSFALIVANSRNIQGPAEITIDVSGCNEPLSVAVDTNTNDTKIKMPVPLSISPMAEEVPALLQGGQLVDFGGIVHIIVRDKEATPAHFDQIKSYIYSKSCPPALGVMFYDTKKNFLTPVVYVKDVDTTYFEGSCGSGSTAVAAALSEHQTDGTFSYTLPQPAGTITVTAEKKDGAVNAIFMEGPVYLDEIKEFTVDITD